MESNYYENFVTKPISKRNRETYEFQQNLDPNMDPIERHFLCLKNLYRRDDDVLKALDLKRPDADERLAAFYESLLDAIQTDEESWVKKMKNVLDALRSNNAEQLLVAICGWGSGCLAKRAGILPDDGWNFSNYYPGIDIEGKLIVYWDNGEKTFSECSVEVDFKVAGFDPNIFKAYANTATITNVIVEWTPYYSEEHNRFNCVSKEERDRSNDEFTYWYWLDDDSENS